MEFSLEEIVALLIKRFVLIIICIFMGLGASFIFNSYITMPSYTATVQMYVNTNDTISAANLSELNYAQKVVTTYIGFLQTNTFYQQVVEESDLNYTKEDLKAMTDIKSVGNTEIFQISVHSHNPKDSFQLVEMMQEVVPRLIKSIKDSAEIRIVDPAILPTAPSSPNLIMNTMIGGMVGFIFSLLAVLLWEIIDVNVKNQEELIKKYDLPILGAIPFFGKNKKKRKFDINAIPILGKRIKNKRLAISIHKDTKFVIKEAYKFLRTNLRFTLRGDACKKIIICSPVSEDGKSTTSANLAITIAQTGAKVLLMDCDLRKGRLNSFFNIKSGPGVSDVLSGMINEKDVIQYTKHENLQVIAMGAIPPNPTELLASVQMEELLKKLEKLYDYIIIDTPPVNVVSDALSLVKFTDGVVIVVRERATTHPNIVGALNKYKFVKANILGFVINGVSLKQGYKSKSNYYYYHNEVEK